MLYFKIDYLSPGSWDSFLYSLTRLCEYCFSESNRQARIKDLKSKYGENFHLIDGESVICVK